MGRPFDPNFNSFFMGGFECSTHYRADGTRLDLVASTHHDRFARQDYQRLRNFGVTTVRDGIRWHLIERREGVYDFSSVIPMLRAARAVGVQVIWDIFHYGYPDDLNIFSSAFVRRYRRFAQAFARLLAQESDETPYLCPVNEISFFSWAGGDGGHLNPYTSGRGHELKRHLVRTAIEGIEALWEVNPHTRIIHTDPLIHIVENPERPHEHEEARGYRNAQFQAWDMLAGKMAPELGGHPKYLDIIGANFYPQNEWVYKGPIITAADPRYVPLRDLLQELYNRYHRPILLAETSIENHERADWFHLVCNETRAALAAGIPVFGICWYPILNHPGWADDRHCHNGLWDYCDDHGQRELYQPLAEEWIRQQMLLQVA